MEAEGQTLCESWLLVHPIYKRKFRHTARRPLTFSDLSMLDDLYLEEAVYTRSQFLGCYDVQSPTSLEQAELFRFDLKLLQFEQDRRAGLIVVPVEKRLAVSDKIVSSEEKAFSFFPRDETVVLSQESLFQEILVEREPFRFEPLLSRLC